MCVQSLTPGKNQCYAIQLKVLTQGIEIQSPRGRTTQLHLCRKHYVEVLKISDFRNFLLLMPHL